MSEKWTAMGRLVSSSKVIDTDDGKKFACVCEATTFQYAQDIVDEHNRLHAEPCPWELQQASVSTWLISPAWYHVTNERMMREAGFKYCRECGRRLGEQKP